MTTRLEDSATFIIRNSTRNTLLAKLLLVLVLTGVTSYYMHKTGVEDFEKGKQLTQEEYLNNFEQYKAELLGGGDFTNIVFAGFTSLVVISFFFGSYELLVILIGLLIGKIIR